MNPVNQDDAAARTREKFQCGVCETGTDPNGKLAVQLCRLGGECPDDFAIEFLQLGSEWEVQIKGGIEETEVIEGDFDEALVWAYEWLIDAVGYGRWDTVA